MQELCEHGNEQLEEQGQKTYRAEMRSAVRALWTGAMTLDQSFQLFDFTIRAGLTAAWHAGMKSVGMLPSDISPEERIKLAQIIQGELSHVFPFLLSVEAGSKANGGRLGPFLTEVEKWAIRYPDVENRARVAAKNDPILQWQINVTRVVKKNCSTCLRLDKKKKRASFWKRSGILPQNPPNSHLICGGWLCGCGLVPAEGPLSRGPLPRTP